MPPSSPRRQSLTPYVPGAWPSCSRDHHDDTAQDADVSSVSSFGSCAINARSRKESGRKARRRWTYAGPSRPYGGSIVPPGLDLGSLSPTVSNDVKLSPVTDATVSTATSSPLNTPDLADWPTHLDPNGGSAALLDSITHSNKPVTRFSHLAPSGSNMGTFYHCPPRLLHSAATDPHFPSPHLDPPLLNFIPGLPPLKVPVHSSSTTYLPPDSPPPGACSTPPSFIIPPPKWAYTPPLSQPSCMAAEVSQSFPQYNMPPLTASRSLVADSPVLPVTHISASNHAELAHQSPSPDVDAFALATAVASSTSHSSFSIPLSVQSGSPLHVAAVSSDGVGAPESSKIAEASVDHPKCQEAIRNDHVEVTSDHTERSIIRRLSAPQPIAWQSPRPPAVRTISSRVDVGEEGGPGKRKTTKQPVMGKVRKFGERLRGLFRSKADTPSKTKSSPTVATPEYGLMRTTTAITNVEYESEHPIPSPSPRTRNLRNHRRSLPLPSLLPSSIDRVHSTIFKRTTPDRDATPHSPVPLSPQPKSVLDGTIEQEDVSPQNTAHHHSPRTPKGRRERTQTAPQTVESEHKGSGNKARRFSLSSALTKSKMDSLRTTVMPRPPLPTFPPREDQSAQSPVLELPQVSPTSNAGEPASSGGQERFWGGELPSVPDNNCAAVVASPGPASPARSRTRTAPPQASSSPHLDLEASAAKDKRSRRFSLSSIMAKRSTPRHLAAGGHASECSSSTSLKKARRLSRRRPRGDTVTTITHGNIQFDMVSPRPDVDTGSRGPVLDLPLLSRSSRVPSLISSNGESTYYDAQEQLSSDEHSFPFLSRPRSPRPESDLDSMSFARTPDYSSGTFSFGSSTEREYPSHSREPSSSTASYTPYRSRRRSGARYTGPGSSSAVAQLVGESTSTPITKTLRFSPSLSLSFDMSCSDVDYGDDDEMERLERQEELSFMRALGFEFDEIARRVREEPF